jgi:MFS family permease
LKSQCFLRLFLGHGAWNDYNIPIGAKPLSSIDIILHETRRLSKPLSLDNAVSFMAAIHCFRPGCTLHYATHHTILNDLRMSYSQMGFILGSWQLTYILVALVAGAILDRWGVRKSIFAGP